MVPRDAFGKNGNANSCCDQCQCRFHFSDFLNDAGSEPCFPTKSSPVLKEGGGETFAIADEVLSSKVTHNDSLQGMQRVGATERDERA
jgi:hypothetical protein